MLVGQIWSFLFQGTLLSALPPSLQQELAPYMVSSTMGLVWNIVLAPIYATIVAFVTAGWSPLMMPYRSSFNVRATTGATV